MMLKIGLLIYTLLIWTTTASHELGEWHSTCHEDCQCRIMTLAQTVMSRWLPDPQKVKAAFCIVQKETDVFNMFNLIPNDTEVFTILQTIDSKEIIISANMTSHLKSVIGMDIQGSYSKGKKRIFITDALKWMITLRFLSVQDSQWDNAKFALSNLSSLECLQVVRCNLGHIEWPMFQGLLSLQELYMVQNDINFIGDHALSDAIKLRRISLSYNKISIIYATALEGLNELEMLDLSNNHLESLSKFEFPTLPRLQWLDLKENPIKVILPNTFRDLNALRRLDIGHKTQLMHITKLGLKGLNSLKFLHIPNIDNEMIKEQMFTGMCSLLHMHLNGHIKAIGKNAFVGVHHVLENLVIHDCQLQYIHELAFTFLTNVTSLDLSLNLLESLPEPIFSPLESLQELILSQNHFKTLPGKIFEHLPSLRTLRLDNNPWNCTCSMASWNEEYTIQTKQIQPIICNLVQNKGCSEYEMYLVPDPRVAPRCEYPSEWQGVGIFDVIQNKLFCEVLSERD